MTQAIRNRENAKDHKVPKSALLAGAALALPLASNADIIFNPTKVTITASDPATDATYNLDLDGDGITDFVFTAHFDSAETGLPFDAVTAQSANQYVTSGTATIFALPLTAGTLIGPGQMFASDEEALQLKAKGLWPNDPAAFRYLGVEFAIGTEFHFGWVNISACTPGANITTLCNNVSTMTIDGFAYESNKNTPIAAGAGAGQVPEPSQLSLLALGVAGLVAFRARKRAA